MMSQVLNHLWQSTLLALALALLVLAFRKAPAGVRHGLWFAASAQFLIPLAGLAAVGRLIGPLIPVPAEAKPEAAFIAQAAQPFSQPAVAPDPLAAFPFAHGPELQATLGQAPAAPPVPHAQLAAAAVHAPPQLDAGLLLLAVWALGSAVMLLIWVRRWMRLRRVVRSARRLDWRAPMPVLAAPSLVEPGLVGLWRPVLLVPETLPEALSRPEIDALIAHEACHLRRRDNLTAALHMLVEALFWFHPLTWWIGARLIEERERACDEAVVRAGHDRAAYARSLVEICRLFLQSPLDCVAGASGSNLKTRVEAIMTAPPTSPLSRSRKALLAAAGACAFATPVMAGLLTTPEGQKAVARARVAAARLAPVALTLKAPSADETAPAKPVVLAQNQSVLAPGQSVARLDTPVGSVAQDLPALAVTQAPAPQAEAAPAAPVQPADPKDQATNFVDFFASTDQHVLARWRDPVCVKVFGLSADQAAAVEARVEQVAKSVGARARPAGCKGVNVEIQFTGDPQDTLDSVSGRTPRALGDWSGTRVQKTVTLPIQAWYLTNGGTVAENSRNNADGMKVRVLYQAMATPCNCDLSGSSAVLGAGPQANGSYVPPGSTWGSNPWSQGSPGSGWGAAPGANRAFGGPQRDLHRNFANALVIVDTHRTEGRNLGLVSDYVALLTLSQPVGLGRCNVLPSVTDLFADCPGRTAPDGLTSADAAFLTALYAAKTGNKGDEQADIATHMASILDKAGTDARAEAAPERPIRPASADWPASPPRLAVTPAADTTGGNPQVSAFIESYGEAFWNTDNRICVKVDGLTPDKDAAFKARVEADARAVGVSIGRSECGLRNQIEIRFAADAERAVTDVLNYYHHPVWPFPLDRPQGADRPIKAFYGMVYDFAGGAGGRGLGAHPNARQKLNLAIVVVDPARTANMSPDAVADYVAMLALSQPRKLDQCNVLPSVTDLFASGCSGRSAQGGLTAADTAYLTALYTGSAGLRAVRSPSELVEGMARRLAGGRGTSL
jgi:beta-lactamase regulating signal transducer with metallopeptidase domain